MKAKTSILWLLLPLLFSSGVFAEEQRFPGRSDYPDVLVYEKSQLFNDFSKVVLVDIRSQEQYETLRIKGAVNIPVNRIDFAKRIKALRASTTKSIVFYCNGRTCNKSYRAGREANILNIEDTYAYDAGVFDWAKTYPNHVTLLGKIPLNTGEIIAEKDNTTAQQVHVSFVEP